MAGKTDQDNDYLSLKLAHPNDWWFHVRGMPGSHIILRTQSNETPDRETLKRTAAIAAYHSKARAGGIIAISCTKAQKSLNLEEQSRVRSAFAKKQSLKYVPDCLKTII